MELGEAHRAEGEGQGLLDQAVHRADQLEAPAADVGDQGPLTGEGEVMGDRAVGQRGLGFGVDDAEGDVELLPDPAHEPRPVLRLAHRGGGDRGDPPDVPSLAHLAHPAQGLDGPVHGRLVEAAGVGEAGREARLVLQLVDDGES